ncbi:Peptide O-xylosyltransferase [Hyphodiscus hymeniophilus]|uniref:Peptide O-xylosyltransferase n=1 Tax=Hyphodiscus hymeniophilus TaxID=353542 RepID=A0A9P6VN89_9HELO|nr:Peptide O-xylosyltransferase [Hyphodiscus hymeniophilus]
MLLKMLLKTPLLASLYLLHSASAASSTTSSTSAGPTSAITPATSVNATIFPGDSTYTYYGCYNETTLLNGTAMTRALTGGGDESSNNMTVETCLQFCKAGGDGVFAGLEYTRECYCAPLLSAVSAKLPDSSCNLACAGNSSQICGGSLVISVYQKQSEKKGAAVVGRDASVGSALALGVAVAVLVGWS